MKWYEWIPFIMSLFPKILEIIKAIEEAIGGGNGEVKKDMAMSMVANMTAAAGASKGQAEVVKALAAPFIDSQVSSINKVAKTG